MDGLTHGVIVLSAKGTIRFATRTARQAIAAYFGGRPGRGDGLPPALRRWMVDQEHAVKRHSAKTQARDPLVVNRQNRRLVVRLLFEDRSRVLVLKEGPQTLSIDALGLTRRQTEVAACLALGRTNTEIAAILRVRPRTVGKHLEQIYRKLGVETRTAAAARVIDAAKTLTV